MSPGIKQFRNEGCLSYLLFDRASQEAALIDPSVDLMDDFREYLADHRLNLRTVIDTHVHADHRSATHLLRREFDCPIVMGAATKSARATHKLADGDSLRLGGLELKAIATPGHTPDSICIHVAGLLFTGDTLLIGATGRTDFPGSDALAQWKSLARLLQLPEDTVVYPGHDYSDLLFSTIGTEKKSNPDLLIRTEQEFARKKSDELLKGGNDSAREIVAWNVQAQPSEVVSSGGCGTACGAAMAPQNSFGTINIEKYSAKVQAREPGFAFLDVREPSEFAEGRIPGTMNWPASELALHLGELRKAKRVYLNCAGGGRSGRAARTLCHLGLPDVVNVSGGFSAWEASGLPVEK